MDNTNTWTGLPVEESIRMIEDRDKFRKYVHGVALGSGTAIACVESFFWVRVLVALSHLSDSTQPRHVPKSFQRKDLGQFSKIHESNASANQSQSCDCGPEHCVYVRLETAPND